jgi:AcrR family transcriptional regulator
MATTEPLRTARRAAALPPPERRSMIVEATLPLLLEHGEMVTTRQIADAAGIAEGTIFRAFADKDAVIAAVLDMAFDTEPLERALAAIDLELPFEAAVGAAIELLQQRVVDIWRLVSSIGPRYHDKAQRPIIDSDALVTLFEANHDRLSVEPTVAARLLRAFTLSVTHPMLAGEPMSPPEIVKLFLYGVCAQGSPC